MICAGVDPGVAGALAVINEVGDLDTIAMPTMGDPRMVDGAAVARWLGDRDVEMAIIEQAHAMPRQGVASSFNFGRTYGQLLGVLQCSLIPYRAVTPQRWKKDLHLSPDKEQSRRMAIETFPRFAEQFVLKKDEARAEAALIAWWWLHGRTASEQHTRVLARKKEQSEE